LGLIEGNTVQATRNFLKAFLENDVRLTNYLVAALPTAWIAVELHFQRVTGGFRIE
jgi:hypothetical protein